MIALSEGPMPARVALEAWHVMMQGDAVADAKPPDTRAETNNGAGGFMSEDARGRDGAVLDFLDVGWTNTADGDLDEQFVGSDTR